MNYPDGVNGSEDYFNPPVCPGCYRELEDWWLFCPQCGTDLRITESDDDSGVDLWLEKKAEERWCGE